jgi:hypothetical protein
MTLPLLFLTMRQQKMQNQKKYSRAFSESEYHKDVPCTEHVITTGRREGFLVNRMVSVCLAFSLRLLHWRLLRFQRSAQLSLA